MTDADVASPWPLKIARLLLRDATPADVEAALALCDDPAVTRFVLRTFVEPDEFRRAWAAVPSSPTDFSCVGVLDGTVVAIGCLEVGDAAGCNADNLASVRVLEKARMRREPHSVQDCRHAELGWVDGYEYALLADAWRTRG